MNHKNLLLSPIFCVVFLLFPSCTVIHYMAYIDNEDVYEIADFEGGISDGWTYTESTYRLGEYSTYFSERVATTREHTKGTLTHTTTESDYSWHSLLKAVVLSTKMAIRFSPYISALRKMALLGERIMRY